MNIYEPGCTLFNHGRVGFWRESLSDELSQRFDDLISEKLTYTGEYDYGTPAESQEAKAAENKEEAPVEEHADEAEPASENPDEAVEESSPEL